EAAKAEVEAAQAAAEAAAQAAADEAAKAEAEAAQAAAEAAAQAAADEAAKAEAEAAEEAAAEAAAQAAADEAAKAETEAAQAAAEAAAKAAAEAAAKAETQAAEEAAAQAAAEAAAKAAAGSGTEAVPAVEPVDIPVPEDAAIEMLTEILSAPTVAEPAPAEDGATAAVEGGDAATTTDPAAALVAAAAAAVAAAAGSAAPAEGAESGEAAPAAAPEPVAVTTEVVTAESARTSDEEFAAAPTVVSEGKKSGLSDLEKVGLLALGALVVGAVINEGKKDERKVVSNTGDRVVIEDAQGDYVIYKDDDAILRRPGVEAVTETYSDGSTRTVVSRADGSQVVTIRDASGRVLRRSYYDAQGYETVLIDDLAPEAPIVVSELPKPKPDRVTISASDGDAALKAELAAIEAESLGRKFSLRQIREIAEVRALAATVEVDSITFDTGSSVIKASEARKLADLGRLMQNLVDSNPGHVFLIEGHTDAVGAASSNLLLSDRRAESLALALTEYFAIPPENLVVQGYGESELKVESDSDERANRRVVVRLITPLMRMAAN
ncbi:MAG: OmpA family protein, partial [Rhodobacteraceae bacterium]|nr:OmpA family protein [Paracoccaceae bacterium]